MVPATAVTTVLAPLVIFGFQVFVFVRDGHWLSLSISQLAGLQAATAGGMWPVVAFGLGLPLAVQVFVIGLVCSLVAVEIQSRREELSRAAVRRRLLTEGGSVSGG